MTGTVVSVWGSPNAGKTTFATKLSAAFYERFGKTVIVLYSDYETPVLPVIFPNFKEHLASVGTALSKVEVRQDDVLGCLNTVKGKQDLGFLGFGVGENQRTFPRFERNKAEDLLDTLRSMADIVVVDCVSNLEHNILAATAMETADWVFRLASPDLKSVSWYLSQLPVYSDKKYRCDLHIQGINVPNADLNMPVDELQAHMKRVNFLIPYSSSVKAQMQEGRLYLKSTDRAFEICMSQIAERVVQHGTV